MPDTEAVQQSQWHDLRPLLDQELSGLPNNYRAVIVLCDLEGNTRREAARQLNVPEGTVAGRLARARVMLAKRLIKRGVVLPSGVLASVLTQNGATAGVPASIVSNAIRVASLRAAVAIPIQVAALTEGVLKTMFRSKLKAVVGVLMVVCLIGIGSAVVMGRQPGSPAQPDEPKRAEPKQVEAKQAEAKQAEAKQAAIKAMQERFQGTWRCVFTHSKGEKRDESQVIFTFQGDTWEVKYFGRFVASGTYKLADLDASPKQIDWVQLVDFRGRQEKTVQGVFMLDGDSLIMCFSPVARPKGFFTESGDDCIAHQLKRVAK